MEAQQKITSLKEGMSVRGINVIIAEKRVGVARNRKSYADLTLQDDSGSIKAKIWDYNEDPVLQVGTVIFVNGNISDYQGTPQMTIETYGVSFKKPEDFIKKSRFDIDKIWEDIKADIENVQNAMIKSILKDIMYKRVDKLLKCPAAKGFHNDWVGGLLEHCATMWYHAKHIAQYYNKSYDANVDLDLLLAGILLHDLGKIYEYDISSGVIKYSARGIMANHIVLGTAVIYESANKWWRDGNIGEMIPEEFVFIRDQLMHLVASHHGRKEWGSPVIPSTTEAVILHQVDMLDSYLMHAIAKIEGGEGDTPGYTSYSKNAGTSYLIPKGKA